MHRRQSLVWVFGLALCILSVRPLVHTSAKSSRPSSTIGGPTQEEYALWTLAIRNVIEGSRPPEMIVIDSETSSPPSDSKFGLASLLESQPKLGHGRNMEEWITLKTELLPETYADFEQKNEGTELLRNNFGLPLRTVTITEEELSQLRAGAPNHFWETLREKYSHAIGVFRVSPIGFNFGRTQAIVYVQYQSGPEGGDGRYVLLRKENGSWTCRAAGIAWMS